MATHNYNGVGLRNVGSYQISGRPWISGSTAQAASKTKMFQFPYVARAVTVFNISGSGDVFVHFVSGTHTQDFSATDITAKDETGTVWTGHHYVPVGPGASMEFVAKCKRVFVTTSNVVATDYRVMAELTNIPTGSMYHLTGSGLTDSSGGGPLMNDVAVQGSSESHYGRNGGTG